MGQDYVARKQAKKQRKRQTRNAEAPGRGRKRKQRGADGLEVVGAGDEDAGLLAPGEAKRRRKKGNNVSLRISRSLCYREPQLTEEDKDWDGSWEGGDAGQGLPALQGLAQSGYDSDVEEQLQKLPPQQRQQQQQQAAKPKKQQQQQCKPKLSTGVGLLDPVKAAAQQQLRKQQQQQRKQQQQQLDAVVASNPALAALSQTLNPLLARCMAHLSHLEPTPIQAAAWPPALSGLDVQGVAEPGSGKTLAYLLPVLVRIAAVQQPAAAAAEGAASVAAVSGSSGATHSAAADAARAGGRTNSSSSSAPVQPRALVLAPSRELAQQVHAAAASLAAVSGVAAGCVTGGVPQQQQAEQLAGSRPGLLVATPGRLLQLVADGLIGLACVACVVLDEADKMLSVGFEPQLQLLRGLLLLQGRQGRAGRHGSSSEAEGGGGSSKAAAGGGELAAAGASKKKKRKQADLAATAAAGPGASQQQQQGCGRPQVLLFTATLPAAVQATADAWLLPGAARVSCTAGADCISRSITQAVHVCAEHKKPAKLLKHLAAIKAAAAGLRNPPRVLVFANKIKTVLFIHRTLAGEGFRAVMLHGKRSQPERNAAVADFKAGKAQVLVASDVASRGLDIRGLPFVVNYDFPSNLETYIHRVGRTGRLAAQGHAFSFFTRSLARLAGPVASLLQAHGQPVDPNLLALADAWRQAEAVLAAQGKTLRDVAAGAAAGSEEEEEDEREGGAAGRGEAAGQLAAPEDLQEGLPKPKQQQGGTAAAASEGSKQQKQQKQQQQLELPASSKKKARREGDMLMVPQAVSAAAGGSVHGSTAAGAAEFLPSKCFVGAKPGMVFTKGPRGLGYYTDTVAAAAVAGAQQQAARKAPAAKQQQVKQKQQQEGKKKEKQQQKQKAAALPMLPGLAMKLKRHAFFSSELSDDDGGAALDAAAAGGAGSDDDGGSGSEGDGAGRGGSFGARLQQQQGAAGAGGSKRKALPGRLRRKLASQKAAQAVAAAASGKRKGGGTPAGKKARAGK